jgi:mono/diheme cytochrome c family protein
MRLRTARSPRSRAMETTARRPPARRVAAPRRTSRKPRAYRVPTGVLVALAGLLSLVLVVLVSYDEPPSGESARAPTGASLYGTYCATCHGSGGQGGVGPRLAGRVANRYPDGTDEVSLVREGKAGMPSFQTTLGPAEIRNLVEYTRTSLGR